MPETIHQAYSRKTASAEQTQNSLMGLVLGLVLAGGQSRRMGGQTKAWLTLEGQSLIERARARLAPQVRQVAINANADVSRFSALGVPVLADRLPGFLGPLAGVHAGLVWAQSQGADWLVVAACDAPFFPQDLVAKLCAQQQADQCDVVFAASFGRSHPVFSLWSVALCQSLETEIKAGLRKVDGFQPPRGVALASWPDAQPDPFFNINTPDQLAQAQAFL